MQRVGRLALSDEASGPRGHACGLCEVTNKARAEQDLKKSQNVEELFTKAVNKSAVPGGGSRNIVSNYSTSSQQQGKSQFLNSIVSRDGCIEGCKCHCHTLHESQMLPGAPNEMSQSNVYSTYSKLPPHAMSLAAPHGSTYLSKSYVSPPVKSEYTESFYHPFKRPVNQNQGSVAPMSERIFNDALSQEMLQQSSRDPNLREKTLYPITSAGYVTRRYAPAVYDTYNKIPEPIRTDRRFHIMQDNERKYHVYDVGLKQKIGS